MDQLAMNQQPTNWLARLKNMVSPTSTAGMLGNQDAYNAHVQQALESGEQPMSRMEFLKAMQSNPQMMQQQQVR